MFFAGRQRGMYVDTAATSRREGKARRPRGNDVGRNFLPSGTQPGTIIGYPRLTNCTINRLQF